MSEVCTLFKAKIIVRWRIPLSGGNARIRASHMQLFWIFMLFQAVNTVKLNFKAGLFSSTFLFEHSFLVTFGGVCFLDFFYSGTGSALSDTPKTPEIGILGVSELVLLVPE